MNSSPYQYIFKLSAYHIVLTFLMLVNQLEAKVDPPNYNFSIDELSLFLPGTTLEKIKEKYKDYVLVENQGTKQTIRLLVTQQRYKFPVFVQLENQVSTGYFARLPSYFLHDLFHQSLINRLGKQDQYNLKDNHAVYVWENKENLTYIYSGACTITCFPIYLAVMPSKVFAEGKLGNKEGHLLLKLNL